MFIRARRRRPPLGRGVPILIALTAALSGCAALPPAATVAGIAANGLSYATTGKGTADHILSSATVSDCALHRGLGEEPVCRDGEAETPAVAAKSGLPAALRTPAAHRAPPRPPARVSVRDIMRHHTRTFVEANRR
ncbi:MAG: hypothetical protein OXR84_11350 [Magnetovibrio sp.]|nr:hypothetical protein [Magnetovibrio sp.]